jgi:hypothetical protein
MSARPQIDHATTMENDSMTATRTSADHGRRQRRLTACLIALASLLSVAFAPSAAADVEWTSEVQQAPTNLPPGGQGIIRIIGSNTGDTDSSGFPSISFELPAGVTLNALTGPGDGNLWSCAGSPTVTCISFIPFGDPTLIIPAFTYVGLSGVTNPGPGEYKPLNLMVDVDPGAPEGTQPFSVTMDGGGDTATQVHQVRIGSEQLPFGPTPGSFEAGAFDAAGADYTVGGGHPYQASASFELNTHYDAPPPGDGAAYARALIGEGALKDVIVDIPAGFVGNPTAGPKCPSLGNIASGTCPPASQVGVASVSPPLQSAGVARMFGIFNMVPDEDTPAQFAFRSPVGNVVLTPVVRSDGDLGLSVHVKNVTQADVITQATATLWGVPADPSHDAQRCSRPSFIAQACVGHDEQLKVVGDPDAYQPHPSPTPRRPFLTNPTHCSGNPLVTSAHFSQWAAPGAFEPDGDPDLTDADWVSTSDEAPPVTGCEELQFAPQIDVQLTSSAPSSPTGLRFELDVPQNDDADGRATAHLRDTTFTLPEGMTVNPSSADGLEACTSAQIGLVSKSPLRFDKLEPSCPLGSKLGTVEVRTPLLDEPLTGDVFLARQADNPFDSLLALYLVVRGPGILVKLAGHVEANPQTGQLTTSVIDNPQLPFDQLTVDLQGGPRAPLTTPATCGPQASTAAMTSWAGHSLVAGDTFTIACPGNAGVFDPGFAAGTRGLVAGDYAPFVTRFTRDVGKELGRIDVSLPKGLLAKVRDVGVCTNAQIASSESKPGSVTRVTPSCPASSQVGTTTVGAGSGPTPFFPALPGSTATGRVFLSDAHTGTRFPVPGMKQTAYGLAIEVPAVAGPFDLGTVMVRAAIFADPETAELKVVSDPLPRILQGIVLQVRDVRVNVDRPNFSVNPTSCEELRIRSDIFAQDGTAAERSSRFQVGDCAALGLAPRVAMRLEGRRQTKLGGNPALRVRVRQGGGQANLRKVKAVLPRTLALDARNAAGDWLCSYEAGQRAECPASSRIGTAKAWSPLLKRPVSGPVYFVKHIRISRTGNVIRTLPTLLLKLSGEADINLRATSASRKGLLISTFSGLPDAKVSRFDMRIKGGARRGILAVTGRDADICRGKQVTRLSIRGQNGKLRNMSVKMKTPCAKARRGARK